jgi:hypothetical protein
MSFELICPKCGAHSGPSIGICPYCKTHLSTGSSAAGPATPPGFAAIRKAFEDGALDQALALTRSAATTLPELVKNRDFAILSVRILIETEATTAQIRSVLTPLLLQNPDDAEADAYLKIVDARSNFTSNGGPSPSDESERTLRTVIAKYPDLDLAHFILGAHLFWTRHETVESARHLETAVKLRPNFLRAWGCLGAIYRAIGNGPLATKAFTNCLRLEHEPSMRKYFSDLLAG